MAAQGSMPKSPTRPTQYPSPQWAGALHRGKPRHSCRGGRPVSPLFKFAERRINGALCGRTTAARGTFNGAGDLVAVPRPCLQHAQNEEFGEAHLDEAIPVRTIGIVYRLSTRRMCVQRSLCHVTIIYLDGQGVKSSGIIKLWAKISLPVHRQLTRHQDTSLQIHSTCVPTRAELACSG